MWIYANRRSTLGRLRDVDACFGLLATLEFRWEANRCSAADSSFGRLFTRQTPGYLQISSVRVRET